MKKHIGRLNALKITAGTLGLALTFSPLSNYAAQAQAAQPYRQADTQQYAQLEQQRIPERPFNTAEEYHIDAKFEDARTWYRMVVNDFPDSSLASEASVRLVFLDLASCFGDMIRCNFELVIATEKLNEANEWFSADLKGKYFRDADTHIKGTKNALDNFARNVSELAQDYDTFSEKYITSHSSKLWKISGIPDTNEENLNYVSILSEQGFTVDISKYLLLPEAESQLQMQIDFAPFFKKINYNARVNELNTNGKIDNDKLRYAAGSFFYHSKKFHNRGKRELEALVESIEDPYSELKYEVKNILQEPCREQVFSDLIETFDALKAAWELLP